MKQFCTRALLYNTILWIIHITLLSEQQMAEIATAQGPHQRQKHCFPSRLFGTNGEERFFKWALFEEWLWLSYKETDYSVICFYCSHANQRNLLPKSFSSLQVGPILCQQSTLNPLLTKDLIMLQERLNRVMLIHVYQELIDSLDLKSIANEFCVRSDYRKTKIPKFWISTCSLEITKKKQC